MLMIFIFICFNKTMEISADYVHCVSLSVSRDASIHFSGCEKAYFCRFAGNQFLVAFLRKIIFLLLSSCAMAVCLSDG